MATQLKLSVFRGPELVREQAFERDIIKIGRLASAHLRLEDSKVSRIHAVIEASSDGSQYAIIDMRSTEGTYVNGEKVSKVVLKDGDQITVGDFRIRVGVDGTPSVTTSDLIASSPAPRRSTSELWQATTQELSAFQATADVSTLSPFAIRSEVDASPQGFGNAQPTPDGAASYASHPGMVPSSGFGPQGQHPSGGSASSGFGSGASGFQRVATPMPPHPFSAAPPGLAMPAAPPPTMSMGSPPMPGAGQAYPGGVAPQAGFLGQAVPQMPSHVADAALRGTAPHPVVHGQGAFGVGADVFQPGYASAGPHPAPAPAVVGGSQPGSAPLSPVFTQHPGVAPGVPGVRYPTAAVPFDPWGSVPSNLASESVAEKERTLEVKLIWGGNSVVDTLTFTDKGKVTLGDERKVTGAGPFQKVIRCDVEVPSRGLPSATWVLAEHQGGEGTSYTIHIPSAFSGRLERADGSVFMLDALAQGARGGSSDGSAIVYPLQAAETLFLDHRGLILQIRYVRRAAVLPLGIFDQVNYAWVNSLILVFFIHLVAISSFLATPRTQVDLTDDLFKSSTRFAQLRLKPEEKEKQRGSDLLSKLKAGEVGAKAKGTEGKAGRTDYDKRLKQGRMAVKGDPSKQELAKSTLSKLFGASGNTGRSYLFGSGGLGGELKGALGGVTGAAIGDATGLGGLGTRGTGPGGGGLSMDSVGLGALGTHGRGGGGTGYGEGIGGLGKKVSRDINISAGSPMVVGSLDKEIIRRVIQQHIAQIRYCYEKELVRAPGLFGKVATQFVISAAGSVQSAEVTESTMGNAEVERCIVSKIRTWQFPKPQGGGIVVVKYPFIFKTTG